MASFADYVTGDLEKEIGEASDNQRARDEKGRFIPDRFKGKDITDVIKSYEELEKMNSRQAQDLGTMRAQVDQLMQIQSTPASPKEEPAKPLTVDDLYENPDANIRRVAKEALSDEVTELRETVRSMREQEIKREMDQRFPGWQSVSQSPEFAEWVNASPYRNNMAVAVRDNGDLAAAQELLGMYYDQQRNVEEVQEREQTVAKAEQAQAIKDATLESSSPVATDIADTYSRNELLEVRLRAKKGDLVAERWLKAHGDDIARAYEEGRIVD